MRNTLKIWKILLSGLGTGWLPLAPGTWGAALAILMAWPLGLVPKDQAMLVLSLAVVVCFWIGVKGSDLLAAEWGKDPSQTVIDEMIGVWIALLGGPITWPHLLLAFVLFRFFDIAKPLGIRKMEHIGGGMGVMLDDALAGVYANIAVQLIGLIPYFHGF